MKTKTFISKSQLIVGTLVIIFNKDTNILEGYLKYNHILSNADVDLMCNKVDVTDTNDIHLQTIKYCNLKNINLISY